MDKKKLPLPSVPELFTDSDMNAKIDSLFEGWADRFPEEFVALKRYVERRRRELWHPKAFSVHGNMLWKCCIPARLWRALEQNAVSILGWPPNWRDHPKFFGKIIERGKAFWINETSRPDVGKNYAAADPDGGGGWTHEEYRAYDEEGLDRSSEPHCEKRGEEPTGAPGGS